MEFHHRIIMAIFLFSPVLGQSEVSLELPAFGYCGESITGSCTATLSDRLTIDIGGRKSHTFTTVSPTDSVIELEGVMLSMSEFIPAGEKFDINVSISFILREAITITCFTDNLRSKQHKVLIKSGNCSSPLIYIPDSAMIQWESPKCAGWEQEPVFTVIIDTKDSTPVMTVENSYVFAQSVEGVVNVSLYVENICGETTLLDLQLIDSDATGKGGLAGDDSSDESQHELEKSLLIFFFIGLAPPLLILMILFTVLIVKKVWVDEK